MALTFPVDTKSIGDIPEFSGIVASFSDSAPDLDGMLKYLCYRFDPNCAEVRKSVGVDEKNRIAQNMAAWETPNPIDGVDDEGNPKINPRWKLFAAVEGDFFAVLDNDDWEFIVSMDIAIHNGNMVMREPIPVDMDPETKGKILLNIQKAIKGNQEAIEIRRETAMKMADGDGDTAKIILSATKAKRQSISPEYHLKNAG